MFKWPVPWNQLRAVWEKRQGIESFLDLIDWDTPVVVWKKDDGLSQANSLQAVLMHPLEVACRLGSEELTQAIFDHAVHKYSMEPPALPDAPALFVLNNEISLADCNNWYEWGVWQAALDCGCWETASAMLPRIVKEVRSHRYGSLRLAGLAKSIGAIPGEYAAARLWKGVCLHLDSAASRVFFSEEVIWRAAQAGNAQVCAHVCEGEPDAQIPLTALSDLIRHGNFHAAFRLFQSKAEAGPEAIERSRKPSVVQVVQYFLEMAKVAKEQPTSAQAMVLATQAFVRGVGSTKEWMDAGREVLVQAEKPRRIMFLRPVRPKINKPKSRLTNWRRFAGWSAKGWALMFRIWRLPGLPNGVVVGLNWKHGKQKPRPSGWIMR